MANVILNVHVTDAETDEPIDLIDGGDRPSILVLPVGSPVPGMDVIQGAVKALLDVPSNGPIPPDAPIDKSVTGSPAFAEYGLELPIEPRIYRVDPAGLSLDLGPLQAPLAGWYVATVPPTTNTWEFQPTLVFVSKSQDLAITGFRSDLTPLAKEVLRLRALWKPQHDLMVTEWGGQESTAVWEMTYNYVYNTLGPPPEGDPLQAYWGDYVWVILDLGVPAREFDLLVERYTRVQTILAGVPWPDLPFFERCAHGSPLTLGKDGQPLTIGNWRLCVPTFSDYFPRDDKQIMQDLGLLWLANLAPIFECIVQKVAAAQKDAQKTAKIWKIASLIVPALILPSPAIILGAVSDLAAYTFLQNVNPLLLQALQLAESAVIGLLGGGATIPGLDATSGKIFDSLLKLTQQFIESEGLQAVVEAAKDAAKLQAMVDSVTGINEIPPVLVPFVTWCLRVGVLDVLIAQLLGTLSGQDVNPQTMITYPLIQSAQNAGVAVPASLMDMVEGKNPDFPAQIPSKVGVAVAVAAAAAGVLTVLGFVFKIF